jgi:hypothetical protein
LKKSSSKANILTETEVFNKENLSGSSSDLNLGVTNQNSEIIEKKPEFSPPSPFLFKPLPSYLIPTFPRFTLVPFSFPPSLDSSALSSIISSLSFAVCAGYDVGDSSLFSKVVLFYFLLNILFFFFF